MPVINSISRSDGGGKKQLPLVSGELEKRSPYSENRFWTNVTFNIDQFLELYLWIANYDTRSKPNTSLFSVKKHHQIQDYFKLVPGARALALRS